MASRTTSPTLIGRTTQLAGLDALRATAASGTAGVALIYGDAGIGKTRLVTEFVDRARADGFAAAVGGCVQLGAVSIAFAPLTEALRQLAPQLEDGALVHRADELQASLRGADDRAATGSVLERILTFLVDVARERPVVLVFEDLHWADASTRDLIAFLGRNLGPARIALVLTYRADEVHRRHPLRPVLTTLECDARVERIELAGLPREEFVVLLAEICETLPAPDAVDRMLARSEGNPFYIEELVASGSIADGLPETLADVIMHRVGAVSEETQAVLHAAAVIDDEVDDTLVATVAQTPVASVSAALREGVLHGLLTVADTTCRFRHALVREALYDDLLPGERARLHVATARTLQDADHIAPYRRWALLAHHWDAARDLPRAYAASVRAAAEAERAHAFADAAEQYERALGLREQVPDDGTGIGAVDLLLRAADAVQASARGQRSLVLAEAALRELGADAPPERRALVLERIGRINWTLHQGPAAVAAYEGAAALVEDRPASQEQAFVLATLGQSLMLRQRHRDAADVLQRAIDVATEVGADAVQGHARCSLAPCLVNEGHVAEGVDMARSAVELSLAAGIAEDVSRGYTNLLHCLYTAGRYQDAADVMGEAFDYVVRVGYARHYGEAIAGNAIAALCCAGRYDDAERVHDDPRIPNGDPYQELRWLPALFARGRMDEARALVRDCLASTSHADDVQFRAAALLRGAQLAVIDSDWAAAEELIAQALARMAPTDDQFYRSFAFALSLHVAAERAVAARARRDDAGVAAAIGNAADALRDLEHFADGLAARSAELLPEPTSWLATGRAEHERAAGTDDADTWARVAGQWDAVGQPYQAARMRLRQLDALLRHDGDRGAAAELARTVAAAADELGAAPLAEQVRDLAHRGRLDLPDRPGRTGRGTRSRRLDVTPRELDVLRLVAEGRTNRQIGAALFISEKTASVHVTNLLRKLGVANRGEAAAVAHRAGIDGTSAADGRDGAAAADQASTPGSAATGPA